MTPLERLTFIGFVRAGCCSHKAGRLRVGLEACGKAWNILYAFVVDGDVVYIGKSVKTLAGRMYGYCNPSTTQRTNVRNNRAMLEALAAGKTVEVYALPDNGLLHFGGFHVDLAAGLEDSLIRDLRPAWNGAASKVEA